MKRLLLLLALSLAFVPGTTQAASTPPKESGLLITPLRQFLSADAGSTLESTFSIANLTDKPLEVSLSVQQFSVTDYVYNYRFEAPTNDWVRLSQSALTLQPNQTEKVPYSINVPSGSAPGGHYYTLFASANLASQGVASTIQAADLIYFTVNGKLTTVSHLQGSSIPLLVFGRTIPFTLNAVDTGNSHLFVYVSGELHGLFVPDPRTSAAHLLLPGAVRRLESNIQSPILPGVYKAVYGYKTDAGWVIQQSRYIIYIPPWFIGFVLAAILLFARFRRKRPPETIDQN